jgi:tricorn protease
MKRVLINLSTKIILLFGLTLLIAAGIQGAETTSTRLAYTPAIGEGKIAFVYTDDIWVADADGGSARRLTSHPGEEQNPCFAPDGKHIAFTATYDGNEDVYVIPTEGGEPKRLTWHPGSDVVRGFTPDGKVLFSSPRMVFSRRHTQFFTVGISGGAPQQLPIPTGEKGAISHDGKYLAYTPLGEVFQIWKNYRGGTASRIWVLALDDLSHVEVPKPAGGCNDTEPMWIGETLYFLSDRDGEFNLYSFNRSSKKVTQCTHHDEFPVASAKAGASKVIYEQAGWIWIYDPLAGKSRQLSIQVAADAVESRPRYASGAKHIRSLDISPHGQRAVLEYRGEIMSVPAKKGDARNVSETPGAHERSPVWSPDGKSIAYFSDASGEYTLIVRPQDGKGLGRSHPIKGAGYYERPVWSPDSEKIAFIDNSRTLSWITLTTGIVKHIATEPIYGPVNTLSYSWSPDSKWLAYTFTNKTGFQSIRLYALESDKSFPLTDGLVESGEPVFDAGGKYLYFLASTDAGPVKNWFDQSFFDMRQTNSVYLAVLAKATPNPMLKESDEETASDAEKDPKEKLTATKDETSGLAKAKTKNGESTKVDSRPAATKPTVVVDLDDISNRIVPLPIETARLSALTAGSDGQIYYIERTGGLASRRPGASGRPTLKRFDMKSREEEVLAAGIDEFRLSADHKKLLYRAGELAEPGAVIGIVGAGKFTKGDGALKLDSVSVRVEPRAEWAQILHEAWRINRDYFYAPNMHGADWKTIATKYESLLPHVTTRGDLSRVMRMMLSELGVGHSFLSEGERLYEPKPIPVGLLGADYEITDGRYRFQRIYGGAFWDPRLRAPLRAPGVAINAGEFLLAVNGKEVTTTSEVYREFEATAGKRTELTVGRSADGKGSHTVVVEPIADELELRNRAWIEANLRKVHERTNGRAAYVYVPNTAGMGYDYFKRYFFPQADKDAIIVDERFNGGGQVADYYIEMLRRPLVSFWATRYGEPIRTPNAAILGPKVMIIDETAGSGGDLLPWMFHKFGLGKLIGKRTWGGLVGILGFPVLMDGAFVTAPNLAIFTEEGWVVENIGVSPEIEVEQDPAAVAAGKDPQLDRAIEVVLDELAANPPPPAPARPPFPNRTYRSTGGNASAPAGGTSH